MFGVVKHLFLKVLGYQMHRFYTNTHTQSFTHVSQGWGAILPSRIFITSFVGGTKLST